MARARDRRELIAIGVFQSKSVPSVLVRSDLSVISTSYGAVAGNRWSIGDFSMYEIFMRDIRGLLFITITCGTAHFPGFMNIYGDLNRDRRSKYS